MRNVVTFTNPDALAHDAAGRFVRLAHDAIAARGVFTVALAGGSTPRLTYSLLASEPYRSQIEWDKIQFFWGDERCVPPDHQDSNYRMAMETMLSKVPVPPEHLHRMRGEDPDPSTAASAYEQEVSKVFASRILAKVDMPRFDLVLLGIGPDGHTLSLFPGSKALHAQEELVVANWVEKFKTWRITMTARLVNNARCVLFQVEGPDKATPLHEILEGEYRPEVYPAQLIRVDNGDCDWLVVP
jgi:6-phosphogluconolactonase